MLWEQEGRIEAVTLQGSRTIIYNLLFILGIKQKYLQLSKPLLCLLKYRLANDNVQDYLKSEILLFYATQRRHLHFRKDDNRYIVRNV